MLILPNSTNVRIWQKQIIKTANINIFLNFQLFSYKSIYKIKTYLESFNIFQLNKMLMHTDNCFRKSI